MIDSSRFVAGNQPIVLASDTPPAVLASGSAVVFAIDRETGERIHLFSLEAGEPLLPLPYAESAAWRIVVVPLEMSCLQPIGSLQDAAGIFRFENWLAKMGEALALFRPVGPAQILRATEPDSGPWKAGRRGRRIDTGANAVGRRPADGRSGARGRHHGACSWFLAGSQYPKRRRRMGDLRRLDVGAASALEPTLVVAVQGLFEALDQVKLRREEEDRRRLTTRLEMNTRVAQDALKRLAGTSGAPGASREFGPPGSDPLFQAVRTIGDFLGMAVCNAPETGHETNALQAIVNASGIRSRRVVLSKNWWRADVGPLIAFRGDGSPVALLPSKSGWLGKTRYRMVDGANQSVTLVNARTAPELMESAVMLYRPLPENLSTKSLLLDAFRSQRSDLRTIFIAGIGAAVLALAIPQGAALLIGDAIPDSDSRMLWQVALGMIAAALGSALFLFTQAIATCARKLLPSTRSKAASGITS